MKTLAKAFLIEWNSLVSWLQVRWVFLCAIGYLYTLHLCSRTIQWSLDTSMPCTSVVRWYSDLLITSEIAVSFQCSEAYAYKFVDLTKLLKIPQ